MGFATSCKSFMAAPCPFDLSAQSFQTLLSQRSHSFPRSKVHTQPSLVLACDAGRLRCLFCFTNQRICTCHRKIIHCATCTLSLPRSPIRQHSQLHLLRVISLSVEPHSTVRNEILQPVSGLTTAAGAFTFRQHYECCRLGHPTFHKWLYRNSFC